MKLTIARLLPVRGNSKIGDSLVHAVHSLERCVSCRGSRLKKCFSVKHSSHCVVISHPRSRQSDTRKERMCSIELPRLTSVAFLFITWRVGEAPHYCALKYTFDGSSHMPFLPDLKRQEHFEFHACWLRRRDVEAFTRRE